jgi:hypothetical protein
MKRLILITILSLFAIGVMAQDFNKEEVKEYLNFVWKSDASVDMKIQRSKKVLNDTVITGRPLSEDFKEHIIKEHLDAYIGGLENAIEKTEEQIRWAEAQQQSARLVIEYLERIEEIEQNSKDFEFITNTDNFQYNFVPETNKKKIRVSTKDGSKYYDISLKDGSLPGQKKIEIFDWQTAEQTDILIRDR